MLIVTNLTQNCHKNQFFTTFYKLVILNEIPLYLYITLKWIISKVFISFFFCSATHLKRSDGLRLNPT